MSVRKYHSVEDMEDTLWTTPGTLSHQRAVRLVLESVSFFGFPRGVPCGVFKFGSIEQADAQREKWEREIQVPSSR
jgi:hypothetical protein